MKLGTMLLSNLFLTPYTIF
uniref:Uncharacterized protein n=1 Tax=Arundo donax TaxID=35708 RepID=A0A0A9C1G0_ARUDO